MPRRPDPELERLLDEEEALERPNNDRDREIFHETYGDAIEWLERQVIGEEGEVRDVDAVLLDLWDVYEANGMIRSATSRRMLSRLYDTGVEAATRDEAAWIPNGEYHLVVCNNLTPTVEDEHFRYLVYVVTRGRLRGQRVVKIYRGEGTSFRTGFVSFGFLTRNGDLRIWERFRQDASEPYVENFALILGRIGGPDDGWLSDQVNAEDNESWRQGQRQYFLVFTRNCAECNRTILNRPSSEEGFCSAHQYLRNETGVHYAYSDDLEREVNDLPPLRRQVSTATPRRPVRVVRLNMEGDEDGEILIAQGEVLMCEVTGKEVK